MPIFFILLGVVWIFGGRKPPQQTLHIVISQKPSGGDEQKAIPVPQSVQRHNLTELRKRFETVMANLK